MIYLGNSPVGIAQKVGDLSQYYKTTWVCNDETNDNGWKEIASVPFEPKIVVFSGGTDSDGHIVEGIYWLVTHRSDSTKMFTGSVGYRNAANHNYSIAGSRGYNDGEWHSSSAALFMWYDGKFYATRVSGNGWWRLDTFTFEFYG